MTPDRDVLYRTKVKGLQEGENEVVMVADYED